MGRPCSVCIHPQIKTIDKSLVDGVTCADLSAKFRVSQDALQRHRDAHIPVLLAKAKDAQEVAAADSLLDQLKTLQTRTLKLLDTAESAGEHKVALSAIHQARANIELLAKLTGELEAQPTVNVIVSPQWVEIRALIVQTLTPFPEAREALARALGEAGS